MSSRRKKVSFAETVQQILNPYRIHRIKRKIKRKKKNEEITSAVYHYQVPYPSAYPTYDGPIFPPESECLNCGLTGISNLGIGESDSEEDLELERQLVLRLSEDDETLAAITDPRMASLMRGLFEWW